VWGVGTNPAGGAAGSQRTLGGYRTLTIGYARVEYATSCDLVSRGRRTPRKEPA
jgi:hypothetical protein